MAQYEILFTKHIYSSIGSSVPYAQTTDHDGYIKKLVLRIVIRFTIRNKLILNT